MMSRTGNRDTRDPSLHKMKLLIQVHDSVLGGFFKNIKVLSNTSPHPGLKHLRVMDSVF